MIPDKKPRALTKEERRRRRPRPSKWAGNSRRARGRAVLHRVNETNKLQAMMMMEARLLDLALDANARRIEDARQRLGRAWSHLLHLIGLWRATVPHACAMRIQYENHVHCTRPATLVRSKYRAYLGLLNHIPGFSMTFCKLGIQNAFVDSKFPLGNVISRIPPSLNKQPFPLFLYAGPSQRVPTAIINLGLQPATDYTRHPVVQYCVS